MRFAAVLILLLLVGPAIAQTPGPPGSAVTTVATPASTQALPMQQSTAAEAGHVFKTSGGNLYTFGTVNTGNAGFLLLIDGTTVPADGALTSCGTSNAAGCLKACYAITGGSASAPAYVGFQVSPGPPIPFVNGIAVSYSSTGCNTKTAGSANVFFEAQVY